MIFAECGDRCMKIFVKSRNVFVVFFLHASTIVRYAYMVTNFPVKLSVLFDRKRGSHIYSRQFLKLIVNIAGCNFHCIYKNIDYKLVIFMKI